MGRTSPIRRPDFRPGPGPERSAPPNARIVNPSMALDPTMISSKWRELIEVLAPTRCVECRVRVPCEPARNVRPAPLCRACRMALPWWRRVDGCPRCGSGAAIRGAIAFERDPFAGEGGGCPGCLSRGSALHRCHALLRYEGSIRRWVPAFKNPRGPFGPAVSVARVIDHLAGELGARGGGQGELDLIVSVPLHPKRRRRRGFNHVDPVARRIATRIGLPWSPVALERTRETRSQASLTGETRIDNVRGAFRATHRFALGCRIGLVDDVLTTGSTLEAAAEALLEAGAFEVRGLTLAATLPEPSAHQRSRAVSEHAVYPPAAAKEPDRPRREARDSNRFALPIPRDR